MKNENERLRMGQLIASIRKSIVWKDEEGVEHTGITQARLAELSGLHRPHIVRLEKGIYGPTFDVLSAIAEALGCRVELVKKEERQDNE